MKRSWRSVAAGLSLASGSLVLGCTTLDNGDADGGTVDPSQLDPLDADCEALTPVDLGATVTSVSTEDELRTALADGGSIQLTANIQASAPFPVDVDAVVDGGGFTIQQITLRSAFNNLPDDQHFSWRSGAAIMARGFVADDQPGTGALTVIDVIFDDNRTKATGPGDIRGGAIYGFAMPDITISGSTFLNNGGSNGGAIGGLGSSFSIIDSVFVANETNGPGGSGALEGQRRGSTHPGALRRKPRGRCGGARRSACHRSARGRAARRARYRGLRALGERGTLRWDGLHARVIPTAYDAWVRWPLPRSRLLCWPCRSWPAGARP